MASQKELEQKISSLRSQESALKTELKIAVSSVRQSVAAASSSLKPSTAFLRGVAVRLCAMADASVAVQFLHMQGRSGDEAEVRSWISGLSAGRRSALLEPSPEDSVATRQLAEATKFLKERQLALWVWRQNTTKGIAPTSRAILDQAGPDLAKAANPKNRYRWVCHFMKRWSGRRARFARGERLSQEEFRAKVAAAFLSPHTLLVL